MGWARVCDGLGSRPGSGEVELSAFFDFSFDVKPGGEDQTHQLVQDAAYVTQLKGTGGRVDIFLVNGFSTCQNPSMRGDGHFGTFEAH